jgi:endonuclease YncB( thermonuclease family)
MLLTLGILVVLGIFGGGRRGAGSGRAEVEHAVSGGVDPGWGQAMMVSTAEVPMNPLDPAPRAEWEVLTSCQLVKTPTNAAHHFRVMRDGKPMVFRLYFVEAPELADPEDDEVADLARYFGWPQKWSAEECADRSVTLGQEAWQAVEGMLEAQPFMVLTRFDRRRESHQFDALVVIQDEQGQRRTLQEWLVERGLAMVTRPSLGWLPIQVSADQFVERLEGLQREAQRQRRGGWGVSLAAP